MPLRRKPAARSQHATVTAEESAERLGARFWYHTEPDNRCAIVRTARPHSGDHFDAADMIVVGDAERCLEKMKRYADLGVDELICYVQFGYDPHASVMRTIDILGREVF